MKASPLPKVVQIADALEAMPERRRLRRIREIYGMRIGDPVVLSWRAQLATELRLRGVWG